jgi:hypothetical protein
MSVYSQRFNWDWKLVPSVKRGAISTCPRCNNNVDYVLAYDGDGIGFPGLLTYKRKQFFCFKCPICPHFEPITKEQGLSLLNGLA